ncbi:MAG: exosortase/archaeosortase family protein [Planctomycetota bacterium]
MTSTPVSNLAQAPTQAPLISKTGKLWIAVIGLLMIAFHWFLISRMVRIALDDPNWSHMLIIPFISIYYIHLNRHKLMATPKRVCLWGLPLIMMGLGGYVLGIFPIKNDMAMGYSMILTIFGICLLLLGPGMMKTLWFPIAFLVFAIKISPAIWAVIASKMQLFAAKGSFYILDLTSFFTGVHATLRGSTIDLDYGQLNPPTPMNVAEACGGMRMLMAFLALGVALAFLFPRAWWQRVIMIALTAPIAIFVNALRVAVLGWLHLVDPALAQGDFHIFVGMLMLVPAAGLLMLVGWCLDKMLIIEGKRPKPPTPLPFERDPQQLHLDDTARLIRGTIIGAGIMVLLGACYVLAVNNLAGGEVLGSILSLGMSKGLMGLVGVMMLAGVVIAWHSIKNGPPSDQVAMSQGVIGGLLVVAILGQTTVINATGVALNKLPLPLRHGIALSFPDQAGDWELLHLEPSLNKSVEDELGTTEYFTRYYVNNEAGQYADVINVQTLNDEPGGRLVGWDGDVMPGEIAKVHVAYYTGMLDTIPHVPDKCWLAAGSEMVFRDVITLKLSRDDYKPDQNHPGHVLTESTGFDEPVRLPTDEVEVVIFTGRDIKSGREMTAMYFFLANGRVMASNHEVRFSFNMKDRYSYYCKAEVMFPGITISGADDQEAIDKMTRHATDLLSDLMPEVMACLPDWTEVQSGEYPPAP